MFLKSFKYIKKNFNINENEHLLIQENVYENLEN